MDNDNRTAIEFLRDEVYLPEFMTVDNLEYGENAALFRFNPKEPVVTRNPSSFPYVTPRGTHIMLSQGGYVFIENTIGEYNEELDLDMLRLREIFLSGRVKIVELNQRFRRELKLAPLEARLTITRLRLGSIPIVKFDFDFGNRGITGDMIALIARHPVPQTNTDIMRN